MPPPRPITFRGRTQSISDWAREVRLTPQNISVRIRRFMDQGMTEAEAIEQALTRPRDPKQPTTRKIEPTTKEARKEARKKRGLPPIAKGESQKVAQVVGATAAEDVFVQTMTRSQIRKLAGEVRKRRFAAQVSKLPPPIDAEITIDGLHTPEAALRALGYDVQSIRVPAGLALIVREA